MPKAIARIAGMDERPLAVELFAGLHGWGEGLVAEGFRVIGFDIVDMCAALGKPSRRYSSKSKERKEWTAQISVIPFPLAQHIARTYKP